MNASPASTAQRDGVVERYFEVSLFLLVTVGFLALASTGQLDLLTTVAVSAALVVRALRYRHHRGPELSPQMVTRLTWFYFVFYGVDYFLLSQGFLVATTHLVLFLAVVKVYSARSNRDYLWLALVAFLEILAAATLTVDTTFLIFFFLFLIAGISTFVSFEIKRGGELARQSAILPTGTPLARRLQRSLFFTAVAVALGTVGLGTAIFFILPRFTTGYFSSYGFQVQQISGFANEVNLGDIGSILKDPTVVMRMRAEGGPTRGLEGLRWRGIALARFDGHRWYTASTHPVILTPTPDGRFTLPLEPLGRASRRLLQYRILLEPVSTDTLFAAAVPLELQGRFRALGVNAEGGLTNFSRAFSLLSYSVISDVGVPPPELLRSIPARYPEATRKTYLQLPTTDPRVPQLAAEVTAGHTNPYDRAAALEQFLRTQFGYTLELPTVPEADPIASFLFERREGHCEYFATAMTVLLRTQGIPARMVNGFLAGEYNEVGDNYIIRASDAHTWVEVFFPGVGWVAFDPTPPDPNPARSATWWSRMQKYYDAFDLWWDEWVINYDEQHQWRLAVGLRNLSRDLVRGRLEWQRRLRAWRRSLTTEINQTSSRLLQSPWTVPVGLAIALLVLLAWGGRPLAERIQLFFLLRRGRSRPLAISEATLAYRQMLRTLARRGYQKHPAQTPTEFAGGISPAELATTVDEFTRVYSQIRFGEPPAREVASVRLLELLRSVRRVRANSKPDSAPCD